MKHWLCVELVTGEYFIVSADDLLEAYEKAEEIGADFSCGCEEPPDVYVNSKPMTEEAAKAALKSIKEG